MILLIDNYDSFSYNLFQMIGALSPDIRVVRNDACTTDQIRGMQPTHIILSPGPGYPADAGICKEAVTALAGIPLLGVCLGHQAICEAFGGTISHAGQLMHGKQSAVTLNTACPLFTDMPKQIQAARYHSLGLRSETLPEVLEITAESDDGEIMGVMHRSLPIYGVQFHPESILTPRGGDILANFLHVKA